MRPARAVMTGLRGIAAAARRRPVTALGVVVGVFALHVFLPPLLLAITRKPWTYFAFNPWLKRLPEYLASSSPLPEKLDFLTRVALFWFSTAALGGGWRAGARARAASAASWADSLECWAFRRGRAAWSAAGLRCSRSLAWSSPGCRAAPSPCSPVSRAS